MTKCVTAIKNSIISFIVVFDATIVIFDFNAIDVYAACALIISIFVVPPTYVIISLDRTTTIITCFVILRGSKISLNIYFSLIYVLEFIL